VLAFDMKTNSAFWLVQSTPAFPAAGPYAFPNTGLVNGQTYLCITLADLKTAGLMAKLMYWAQGPNVYAHSQLPKALSVDESVKLSPDFPTKPADMKDHAIGYLAHLMNNSVDTMAKEFAQRIPFRSKASPKSGGFMVIAKNKTWGKDFYNDLVGPTLHENIDVETWEHDPTPGPTDSDHVHRVTAMKSVNLAPLGIPISWSEEQDHAKLAISDKTESNHWICVGDINFTIAQEKRGGGTVAFRCEPLWKSLSEILSTEAEPKAKAARASKS
jgi:deoxyribonuclease-2